MQDALGYALGQRMNDRLEQYAIDADKLRAVQQAMDNANRAQFVPEQWSKEVFQQFQQSSMFQPPKINPVAAMQQVNQQYQDTLVRAIKQSLKDRVPRDLRGDVTDNIIDALVKVDEQHVRWDKEMAESWRYRLYFDFGEGNIAHIDREYKARLDDLRTVGTNNASYLRTPYEQIMNLFALTRDEVAQFAVAVV